MVTHIFTTSTSSSSQSLVECGLKQRPTHTHKHIHAQGSDVSYGGELSANVCLAASS